MLKNKLTSLFISLARIHFHQVPCFKIYFSHIPAFSNSLSHYYSYRHPFILVHFCPQISRNLNQISKFYHKCLHFSIICALYFVRMKLNSARSRKIRKKNQSYTFEVMKTKQQQKNYVCLGRDIKKHNFSLG